MNTWIYDIETYPNVFTFAAENADTFIKLYYEVSPWRDDSTALLSFLSYLAINKCRMIGFNNVGFDYPLLHMMIKMQKVVPATIYAKAQAIIDAGDTDARWAHQVYPSDRFIEQVDLMKIHHFDNVARMTSLKALEFNMRLHSIEDLPFPPGTVLNEENTKLLKSYNQYDVTATKMFYLKSLDAIKFRDELSKTYGKDFLNHNDTKIGKDFFIMELEKAGIPCYKYGCDGRVPLGTPRSSINLGDLILPWINFEHSAFTRVLNWLKAQTITETKGVFKDLKAHVHGLDYVFALGGIHASVESQVVTACDDYAIIDIDVESYYPSLAIGQGFKPAHFPDKFCEIYADLKTQRKSYAKGTAQNAMLKLALNGVYGDSNNRFSPFYDPAMTMSITLNGQLLLCYLVDKLITNLHNISIIQANTDGITVRIHRSEIEDFKFIVNAWETTTKLKMEYVEYSRMFIRDVNNYIAETVDGKRKFKGAYAYNLSWHQDHSAMVVPKVVEKVLCDGANIRETVTNWPEILDFACKIKVPKSSHLTCGGQKIQNTTRYIVTKTGGNLVKWMPPLKGKTEWRQMGVESGWNVTVCNNLDDLPDNIDFEYYINEVEKLCLIMR